MIIILNSFRLQLAHVPGAHVIHQMKNRVPDHRSQKAVAMLVPKVAIHLQNVVFRVQYHDHVMIKVMIRSASPVTNWSNSRPKYKFIPRQQQK